MLGRLMDVVWKVVDQGEHESSNFPFALGEVVNRVLVDRLTGVGSDNLQVSPPAFRSNQMCSKFW